MAKSGSAAAPSNSSSARSGSVLSKFTWYELLAIPMVGVGVGIWFFWAAIGEAASNAYIGAQEAVILSLGVGVVPLALWVLAALGTLALKPRWFLRFGRIWIASVPAMAAALGALSLFRPVEWYTLNGYASLGGEVGEMIAGGSGWQAGLRLGALAVVAVAVASPGVVSIAAKSFLYMYIGLVIVAKGVGGMFKRKPAPPIEYDEEEQPELSPYAVAAAIASVDAYADERRDDPDYADASDYADDSLTASAMGPEGGDAADYDFSKDAAYADIESGGGFAAGADADADGTGGGAHQSDGADSGGLGGAYGAAAGVAAGGAHSQHPSMDDIHLGDYDLGGGLDGADDGEDDEFVGAAAGLDGDAPHRNGFHTDYFQDGEMPYRNIADAGYVPGEALSKIEGLESEPYGEDDDDDGAGQPFTVMDTTIAAASAAAAVEDDRLSGLRIPDGGGEPREPWATPPIEMLEGVQDRGVPEDQIRETAETIRQTLADYDIEVEIGNIKYGPTVTMYGIIPGWIRKHRQVKLADEQGNPILDEKGKQVVRRQEQKTRVKVDAILSREKDLSLALRTPNLRLETPVMGKAQVGIEIPNREPSPVTLRSIMESPEYQKTRGKADLPVALGKGTGGENIALDLAKMPHLLIAGATGSGKSVALNAIVSGLLMERSPADLRMILIDPKRVELTPYNGIPHLLCPVIVEVDEVVGTLKGVINEMMSRYRLMEELGARNIASYNERMPDEKMPFLLVVVDELADLMMTAAFDVEQSLCRLAQLGRATGIHLILATQRPSVDVVTGLIKANFPSRVSFGVTSHIDSRTILDTNGAEKLLGKGDMLYLPRDAARPLRAQGAFISDEEIDRLIDFWKSTPERWMPEVSLHSYSEDGDDDDGGGDDDAMASTDALFDKAVELAHTQKKLSTSLLQRRLRIGYPRAARLMDELEENGVVGASDGSKSREVIMG